MADSVESFVEKLQKEGVDAGRAEAGKIAEKAKAEGEKVVADAKAEADRIIQAARTQAEQTLAQGRNELEMAGRDALLRLRQTIGDVLKTVLHAAAAEALSDDGFFADLLQSVVLQYAEKDAMGKGPVEIHVNADKLKVATEWAIRKMTEHGGEDWARRIDLKDGLQAVGFEYRVSGGTVEVTAESVAAVLAEMVGPQVREIIDQAAGIAPPAETPAAPGQVEVRQES